VRRGRLHDHFASYGAIFWAADIIERVGDVQGIELGLLAGIPMALGSTGLIVFGRLSDRSGEAAAGSWPECSWAPPALPAPRFCPPRPA
jgi:hypothetical protein